MVTLKPVAVTCFTHDIQEQQFPLLAKIPHECNWTQIQLSFFFLSKRLFARQPQITKGRPAFLAHVRCFAQFLSPSDTKDMLVAKLVAKLVASSDTFHGAYTDQVSWLWLLILLGLNCLPS